MSIWTQAAPLITGVGVTNDLLSDAALLRFEETFADRLVGLEAAITRIVIHGDVVIDERERAIDIELLRAELPGGDRPAGSEIGLQGGRFESWAVFRNDRDAPLDLNLAALDDLITLPGIGNALAERILEFRRERGPLPQHRRSAASDRHLGCNCERPQRSLDHTLGGGHDHDPQPPHHQRWHPQHQLFSRQGAQRRKTSLPISRLTGGIARSWGGRSDQVWCTAWKYGSNRRVPIP